VLTAATLFSLDAKAENSGSGNGANSDGFVSFSIPDVDVVDHAGRRQKFFSDLVRGKTVAINFIFTKCNMSCPMLSAAFAATQNIVGEQLGRNIRLISVSVDPEQDTPEALKTYAEQFGALLGWSFVTGQTREIEQLLKAFGVNAAAKGSHSSLVLVGDGRTNKWRRMDGLSEPSALGSALLDVAKAQAEDRRRVMDYFTNLPLTDQDGHTVKFFDDVMRDRRVLITSFYGSCSDVCPMAIENLRTVEAMMPESDKRDMRIVVISVDPEKDTPDKLRQFFNDRGLSENWTLLTGKKENVDWVLHKLGLYVEQPERHETRVLIGDDRTGSWVKLLAMSAPEQILKSVAYVSLAMMER
jgi:protein SCO1/2